MKKKYLCISLLIIFFSCQKYEEKNKSFTKNSEIYYRCYPPMSYFSVKYQNTFEYEAPTFLIPFLDTIILEEKKCMCSRNENFPGFHVLFEKHNQDLKIFICSAIVGLVNEFSDIHFFKYKSNYFLLNGDFSFLNLTLSRNFKMLIIKTFSSYEVETSIPESMWEIIYTNDEINSIMQMNHCKEF